MRTSFDRAEATSAAANSLTRSSSVVFGMAKTVMGAAAGQADLRINYNRVVVLRESALDDCRSGLCRTDVEVQFPGQVSHALSRCPRIGSIFDRGKITAGAPATAPSDDSRPPSSVAPGWFKTGTKD
jgi:hypothetical protein